MSIIAPISALSIPSVHLSDDEHQEILEEFSHTNYGEKFPSQILIPHNVTLTPTLHNAKFPEKTSGNANGRNFIVEFPSG